MSLSITPELVRELQDTTVGVVEWANIGIVLGEEGWEVTYDVDGLPAHLTACTKENLDSYGDGEPLDDTLIRAFAAELTEYTIPTEVTRTSGADWRIAYTNVGDPIERWGDAVAFDASRARRLAVAVEKNESLWITETGTYLYHGRDTYRVIDAFAAFAAVYRDGMQLMYTEQPMLIEIAETIQTVVYQARALPGHVDVIDHPDDEERQRRAWDAREESAEAVRTLGALSDVIRGLVLPDLRRARATHARNLVTAYGTQTAAAEILGITQERVAQIVS